MSLDAAARERAQHALTARVARSTGVKRAASAALLLRHHRWDEALAVAATRADRAAALAEAGVEPAPDADAPPPPPPAASGIVACGVCLDDVPVAATSALACGHRFCVECFGAHLRTSARSGGPGGQSCLEARCPAFRCTVVADEDAFRALVGGDDLARHARALALSFVDDNDQLSWCPFPGCDQSVACARRRGDVRCARGHPGFCFACRAAAHAPCACGHVRAWLEKDEEKRLGRGKLTACENVKPCPNPKCNIPTTKISGCMCALSARALSARAPCSHSKRARRDRHLTCTKCREQWCWQCGSWGGGPSKRPPPHHVHDCNSPPDADWVKDGGKLFDNDGRFMFYYERFQNHADAMRFAEQQRESARERVRKLEAERDADQTAMELAYISDAVALVIECRRTLQWT